MGMNSRRTTTVTVALLLIVGARALSAAPPPTTAELSIPAQKVIPGLAPTLPWPVGAHAALDVLGLGMLPGSNATEPLPIGSVAKIMTAYLVLRAHPLNGAAPGPTLTVTAGDIADYQSRRASGQSLLAVSAGEHLSERQALQALLLPSANNIAVLLARWTSGNVTAFVAAMNRSASTLHLTATRYTDPSGYAPTTVSSADDQIRLSETALQTPGFEAITSQRTATLPFVGRVRNYNTLLGSLGVIGVKTGSTDAAGGNIVFAAHRIIAGHRVTFIGALLGQAVGMPAQAALGVALGSAQTTLTVAETIVRPCIVLPEHATVARLRPAWAGRVALLLPHAASVLGWPGLLVHLTVTNFPVSAGPAGRRAGRLSIAVATAQTTLGSASAEDVPLVTGAALDGPSLFWRVQRAL